MGLEKLAQRESSEGKGYLKQRMEGGPEGRGGIGGKATHLSPQPRRRLKVGHQPGQTGGEAQWENAKATVSLL